MIEKNLYQRLESVRKQVPELLKDSKNKSLSYNYVSSSKVLSSIREAMDKEGVVLIPRIKEHKVEIFGKNGAPGSLPWIFTTINIDFMWVNVDKPEETLLCEWVGQGLDKSERGLGKAFTYAEKYFLLKFFQIPTPEDDVDSEQGQGYVQPYMQKRRMPDITKPGWEKNPVPFQKTQGMTWEDLARKGAKLPNGENARGYLRKLADWKEKPEIAEVASAALMLGEQDDVEFPGWEREQVPGESRTWEELASTEDGQEVLKRLASSGDGLLQKKAKLAMDLFAPPF